MDNNKIEVEGLCAHPSIALLKIPVGKYAIIKNRKAKSFSLRCTASQLKHAGKGEFKISVKKTTLLKIGAKENDIYIERIK